MHVNDSKLKKLPFLNLLWNEIEFQDKRLKVHRLLHMPILQLLRKDQELRLINSLLLHQYSFKNILDLFALSWQWSTLQLAIIVLQKVREVWPSLMDVMKVLDVSFHLQYVHNLQCWQHLINQPKQEKHMGN